MPETPLFLYSPRVFKAQGHGPEITAIFTGKVPGIDTEGLFEGPVYFPKQEHTDKVFVLIEQTSLDPATAPAVADAVVTNLTGVVLGVKVADCVPILLYDPASEAVGVVHAGWRGTSQGIVAKTVKAMAGEFGTRPEDILMAIGPSISSCCYEVGDEVAEAVRAATGGGEYVLERGGSIYLDLQEANRLQALASGLKPGGIEVLSECTCCSLGTFNSWRCGKEEKARQGGFISLGWHPVRRG